MVSAFGYNWASQTLMGYHKKRGQMEVKNIMHRKIEANEVNCQILSQFLNEQLRMAKKRINPSAEDILEDLK